MSKRNRKGTTVAHTEADTTVQQEVAAAVRSSGQIVTEGLDGFTAIKRKGGGGRQSQYPIRDMQNVGDQFFVSLEGKKEQTVRVNLTSVAKNAGIKVSSNKGQLNGVDGLLVTRVE